MFAGVGREARMGGRYAIDRIESYRHQHGHPEKKRRAQAQDALRRKRRPPSRSMLGSVKTPETKNSNAIR